MDGGQWTPASRSRYNLRDTVARCTTQVCVMNFHIQNGVFRTQYSNTTFIIMERGFKMNECNAKHSILNANPIGLKKLAWPASKAKRRAQPSRLVLDASELYGTGK